MGIFLICALAIIVTFIIVLSKTNKDRFLTGIIIPLITMFIVLLVSGSTNTKYAAEIEGYLYEIYFDNFSQNGNIVTIDDYYTRPIHWTDFEFQEHHTNTLTIYVPSGHFEYKVLKPEKQKIISGCEN
jgi:energy-coupling factor transporter transmembrane protein EcfT